MTQHGYFDPSHMYSGPDIQARQAAQDAAGTLGQDYVNQQLIDAQRFGDQAARDAAERAAAEAYYVRHMDLLQRAAPPVGYVPRPVVRRPPPPPPSPQELARREAERQQQAALAAERQRVAAIRNEWLRKRNFMLLVIEVPAFIAFITFLIPGIGVLVAGTKAAGVGHANLFPIIWIPSTLVWLVVRYLRNHPPA